MSRFGWMTAAAPAHLAWARLKPRIARSNGGNGRAGPVRSTPITLVARRHARHWKLLSRESR